MMSHEQCLLIVARGQLDELTTALNCIAWLRGEDAEEARRYLRRLYVQVHAEITGYTSRIAAKEGVST